MFVLSFENENDRTSFSRYYVPNVQIQDFNVLINGKYFFDIPIKNGEKTCDQIIEMGRNNDYTTDNLLDYEYFSKHYKLSVIDQSKQIELENSDLKKQIYLFKFIGRVMQIIEMGRNNVYTTDNLLDYEYFSKHYKLTVIDLSKQIELENSDLKQQIYLFKFIGRVKRDANYWNGKKQWLHDRQFIRLWVFFKALQINCNRSKQINWIRKLWFEAINLFV